MQLNGKPISTSPITGPGESLAFRRPAATRRWQSSSDEDEEDPRGRIGPPANLDVQKSLDEIVSSPDGTPSFISVEDRLRNRLKSPKGDHLLLVKSAGRDFGGSASGNTSQAGSDTEFSAEEDTRKRLARGKLVGIGVGRTGMGNGNGLGKREPSGMGRGALADALGDQSDVGSDAGDEGELEDLNAAEKEDKSIKGSVY
jgi:hypothetical protein